MTNSISALDLPDPPTEVGKSAVSLYFQHPDDSWAPEDNLEDATHNFVLIDQAQNRIQRAPTQILFPVASSSVHSVLIRYALSGSEGKAETLLQSNTNNT